MPGRKMDSEAAKVFQVREDEVLNKGSVSRTKLGCLDGKTEGEEGVGCLQYIYKGKSVLP